MELLSSVLRGMHLRLRAGFLLIWSARTTVLSHSTEHAWRAKSLTSAARLCRQQTYPNDGLPENLVSRLYLATQALISLRSCSRCTHSCQRIFLFHMVAGGNRQCYCAMANGVCAAMCSHHLTAVGPHSSFCPKRLAVAKLQLILVTDALPL